MQIFNLKMKNLKILFKIKKTQKTLQNNQIEQKMRLFLSRFESFTTIVHTFELKVFKIQAS